MSLLLALLSIQLPTAALGTPPQRFAERVEVTEVVVHAVVTDRAGRPVMGLGPGDFVVHEEGSPVEVTSARFYHWGRGRAGELPVEDGPARFEALDEGRLFIFLFHDLRRSDRETLGVASHQLRAGRDARSWLDEGMAPGDLAAVAGYDYRLKIQQDFTHDRAALGRAIDRAVGRRPEGLRPAAPGAPSLLAGLPAFAERRDRSARLRDALKLLAEAVRPVPGPKSLLLFSVGVGLDGPERGLLGPRDEPTLVETLNDSELAVYSLDTTPPEVEHSQAAALGVLAERTGGEYFGHIRRFTTPLRRIERRLQGYYLLTFLSPGTGDGYRRIRVTTRDGRLRVIARRGYLAGPGS